MPKLNRLTKLMLVTAFLFVIGVVAVLVQDRLQCNLLPNSILPGLSNGVLILASLLALTTCIAGFTIMIKGLIRNRREGSTSGMVAVAVGGLIITAIGTLGGGERRLDADALATQHLRTLAAAEAAHFSNHFSYAGIDTLIQANLIDAGLNDARLGYHFAITVGPHDFTATAKAVNPKQSCWDYYTTSDGVIRYSSDANRAPNGAAGAVQ